MGGTKKKPISQAEKAQAVSAKKAEKKGSRESKLSQIQSRGQALLVPRLDDKMAAKIFGPLKAVTIYSAARAMGVSPSVATSVLRSLESKAILRKIGGYSGHYVYSLATSSQG